MVYLRLEVLAVSTITVALLSLGFSVNNWLIDLQSIFGLIKM